MSKPLVSVIIPVYNVAQYLPYCMESVFKQSYENLEIILVDDGSTDGSGKMCDDYASQNDRVKVLHKQNGGLSSARNAGIEIMSGEYVVFIDSDDYVRIDYVQMLLDYAERDETDLVIGSYMKVEGERPFNHITEPMVHMIFTREETQYQMLSRRVPMYAVAKLYRERLFRDVRFPEGKLYEDVPTSWSIVKLVEQVTYIDVPLYYYRQRPDSIVNVRFNTGRMDQVSAAESIYEEVKENEKLCRAAASRCFYSMADNYALVTKEFTEEKRYLKSGLIKYRRNVLSDRSASKSLKVMALAACLSTELVRVIGKCYKQYNKLQWRIKK